MRPFVGKKSVLIAALGLCSLPLSIGQSLDSIQPIYFDNYSLEGTPTGNSVPSFWESCASDRLPDVQPGSFGVKLPASDGRTYVAMLAREDGKTDIFYQSLKSPLRANVCYRLSVWLAKADKYENVSQATGQIANYNRPLKLMIWGSGDDNCSVTEADWLAETQAVVHDRWKKYTFFIHPPKTVTTLVLSVGHVANQVYNGNLLIDNLSVVVPVDCSDLRMSSISGTKSAMMLIHTLSEGIKDYAPKIKFKPKSVDLMNTVRDEATGALVNKDFDALVKLFEKYDGYKLVIRIKNAKKLTKGRIATLYNYVFRASTLKAQRLDIKKYSANDEMYFWTFENDDIAISFDSY